MNNSKLFLRGVIGASLLTVCLVPTASAATIWAPMWDTRHLGMTWEIKASDTTMTSHAFIADVGSIDVTHDGGTATISGTGDLLTGPLSVTPGNIYTMTTNSGFHIRPHWEGIEWARLGPGQQAPGPGTNIGFQADAELGFDARWENLPSVFADTTWSFFVDPGETLSVSVEHMVGDTRGAKSFEFISPSGTVTMADADGMPGSGTFHNPARGGSIGSAPNPSSVYWDEYTAPVSEAGWWGFRLNSYGGEVLPWAWH